MSSTDDSTRAFTLIELLVVIAIIGILSAVVLASLGTARDRARDTAIVAQVKSVKTALEMFYAEHGRYPQARNASNVLVADHTQGILSNTILANTDSPSAGTFISQIPASPSGQDYQYVRATTMDGYAIRVVFIDTNRAGTVNGVCKTGVNVNPGFWGATSTPECIGL